ncbi:hypothetical protein [Mesorhizobium sp.]|uniref:hypothetical protein n=1 Tax=Mesorhizobium sp. TaxID=1871066 RepID=UPI00121B74BA|nr:hypothetical protein [Mesorhizobium sp.]TIX28886.1 MAG: hypothetical protein E5V35_00560 [Mesorhizobium sp.]
MRDRIQQSNDRSGAPTAAEVGPTGLATRLIDTSVVSTNGGFLVPPRMAYSITTRRERRASKGFRRHARMLKRIGTWPDKPVSPRVKMELTGGSAAVDGRTEAAFGAVFASALAAIARKGM